MKCVVQDHSLYLQIQKNVFVLEYILSLLINARFHNEETHPQSTKEGFKCKTLQKMNVFFMNAFAFWVQSFTANTKLILYLQTNISFNKRYSVYSL